MKNKRTSYRLAKGLRVFRTSYRDASGTTRLTESWYVEFRDHQRTIRRLPAFPDRPQSEDLARKLVKLVAWKVSGELPDPATSEWIGTMPNRLRDTLARWEILDARRVAIGRPLAEHLTDWRAALIAKGNTARHADLVTGRARKVIEGCRFVMWSDISASRTMAYLNEMRQDRSGTGENRARGISAQTFNFYLQAVKQLCRWMVKDRRASDNPLSHLDGLNVKTDRRHDRRAFTVDELRWLLKTTSNGPERFGMDGPERAMLYRLGAETGFRRGELASLIRWSFDLDSDEPGVTVSASYAKARRERRPPLSASLVADLRPFLANKMPEAPVFRVPSHKHSAKMIQADLAASRAAWIADALTPEEREKREKSNFCRYRDDAGRYLDFHALRHTRGVWLFEHHKAHPREVQELMGVSTLTLVDRYTRSFRLTDLAVIERGPDLSTPTPEAAKSTGTDAAVLTPDPDPRLARSLARFRGPSGDERQQDGRKGPGPEMHKPRQGRGLSSGEGEIRIWVTVIFDGARGASQ